MKGVIWKHDAPLDKTQEFVLPNDGIRTTPLSVGIQDGNAVVWCLKYPEQPRNAYQHRFRWIATGEAINTDAYLAEVFQFVGTVDNWLDTGLVFHLFYLGHS